MGAQIDVNDSASISGTLEVGGAARFNNTVVVDGELTAEDDAELKKDLKVGQGIVAKRAILNESLLVEGNQNVQGALTVGSSKNRLVLRFLALKTRSDLLTLQELRI